MPKRGTSRTSDHHVLPTSLGGSDHEVNLIRSLHNPKHNGYHQWGLNREPCQNIRLAALNSIATSDQCLDAQTIQTINEITTLIRWNMLYRPEAIDPINKPSAPVQSLKTADFMHTFWLEEQVAVRSALHVLFNGDRDTREMSRLGRKYTSDVMIFFDNAKRLPTAMRRFLTDKHRSKLTWVNSVQDITHHDLLQAVEAADIIPAQDQRNDLERVLETQEVKLTEFIAETVRQRHKLKEMI